MRYPVLIVLVVLLSQFLWHADAGGDLSVARFSAQEMREEYHRLVQNETSALERLAHQQARDDFIYRTCLHRVAWSKWDGGPTHHQKIVFIKTHKTAGSVVAAALFRGLAAFGHKVAVPNDAIKWAFPAQVSVNDVAVVPGVDITTGRDLGYDAFVNHACYCDESDRNIAKLLSFEQDVAAGMLAPFYVTVLREPRRRFLSAVLYYSHSIQSMLANEADMMAGLVIDRGTKHHQLKLGWEIVNVLIEHWKMLARKSRLGMKEVWYNGQSYELGLWNCEEKQNMLGLSNATVNAWLAQVESKFDLVMFTEHLPESMVMLAERLNWPAELLVVPPMKLTYALNVATDQEEREAFPGWDGLSNKQQREVDKMLTYDHQLYTAFYEPFLTVMERKRDDDDFQAQLHTYKERSDEAKQECLRQDQEKRDSHGSSNALVECDMKPLPQITTDAAMRAMHSFWIDEHAERFASFYDVAAKKLQDARKENNVTVDCGRELHWDESSISKAERKAALMGASRADVEKVKLSQLKHQHRPRVPATKQTLYNQHVFTRHHRITADTYQKTTTSSRLQQIKETSVLDEAEGSRGQWPRLSHEGAGTGKAEPTVEMINHIGSELRDSPVHAVQQAMLRNVGRKVAQGANAHDALVALPQSVVAFKKKLVFIKTHKTAGTVVSAAMFKALVATDYRVAAPFSRIHWAFPGVVTQEELFPTWGNMDVVDSKTTGSTHKLYRYDAFLNHACFCEQSEEQIMRFLGFPADVGSAANEMQASPVFVTVLRDHRSRFFSSVRYYGNTIVEDLMNRHLHLSRPLPSKPSAEEEHGALKRWWALTTILVDDYDIIMHVTSPSARYQTYQWYNGQSYELGLWSCRPQNWEPTQEAVEQWLDRLESRFELVMFTEHMAESMMMLAQLFDWPVELMVMPPMKLTRVTDNEEEELNVYPGWDGLSNKQQRRMDEMLHYDRDLYHRFHEPFLAKLNQQQNQNGEFDRLVDEYKTGYLREKEECIKRDKERKAVGRALDCEVESLPEMTVNAVVSSLDLMIMQDNAELLSALRDSLLHNDSAVSGITEAVSSKKRSHKSGIVHTTSGDDGNFSWIWIVPAFIVVFLCALGIVCMVELKRAEDALNGDEFPY